MEVENRNRINRFVFHIGIYVVTALSGIVSAALTISAIALFVFKSTVGLYAEFLFQPFPLAQAIGLFALALGLVGKSRSDLDVGRLAVWSAILFGSYDLAISIGLWAAHYLFVMWVVAHVPI